MEFHDRRGEGGTGKGRIVDLTDGGIGETQRRFNQGHFENTAATAASGSLGSGTIRLSVEEAQQLSAKGTSLPIGGDELKRAKNSAEMVANFKTYGKFRASNGKLKGTKGVK